MRARNVVAGYKGLLLAIFGGDLEDIFSLGENDFRKIDDVLKSLTPREQEVIKLRFGLNGEPQAFRSIGDRLDFTPERIRQILAKSLRRLRMPRRADNLRYYSRSGLEKGIRSIRERLFLIEESMKIMITELSALKTDKGHESESAIFNSFDFLNTPLENVEMTVRLANCLKNNRIMTIGELAAQTESDLLRMRNVGRRCLNEAKYILAQYGLTLGMKHS